MMFKFAIPAVVAALALGSAAPASAQEKPTSRRPASLLLPKLPKAAQAPKAGRALMIEGDETSDPLAALAQCELEEQQWFHGVPDRGPAWIRPIAGNSDGTGQCKTWVDQHFANPTDIVHLKGFASGIEWDHPNTAALKTQFIADFVAAAPKLAIWDGDILEANAYTEMFADLAAASPTTQWMAFHLPRNMLCEYPANYPNPGDWASPAFATTWTSAAAAEAMTRAGPITVCLTDVASYAELGKVAILHSKATNVMVFGGGATVVEEAKVYPADQGTGEVEFKAYPVCRFRWAPEKTECAHLCDPKMAHNDAARQQLNVKVTQMADYRLEGFGKTKDERKKTIGAAKKAFQDMDVKGAVANMQAGVPKVPEHPCVFYGHGAFMVPTEAQACFMTTESNCSVDPEVIGAGADFYKTVDGCADALFEHGEMRARHGKRALAFKDNVDAAAEAAAVAAAEAAAEATAAEARDFPRVPFQGPGFLN